LVFNSFFKNIKNFYASLLQAARVEICIILRLLFFNIKCPKTSILQNFSDIFL